MAVPPESSVPELPELVTNPLACVSAAPCLIRVGFHTVQVPAMQAAQWLELLMGDIDLELIFPGLLEPEDRDLVDDMLLNEELTIQDLERRALEIISEVSGRSWWVTLRMIQLAEARWSVLGGSMVASGIQANNLPLGGWLDCLWIQIFRSLHQDNWTMIASLIEAVPSSEMPEDPMEAIQMSEDAFAGIMAG